MCNIGKCEKAAAGRPAMGVPDHANCAAVSDDDSAPTYPTSRSLYPDTVLEPIGADMQA